MGQQQVNDGNRQLDVPAPRHPHQGQCKGAQPSNVGGWQVRTSLLARVCQRGGQGAPQAGAHPLPPHCRCLPLCEARPRAKIKRNKPACKGTDPCDKVQATGATREGVLGAQAAVPQLPPPYCCCSAAAGGCLHRMCACQMVGTDCRAGVLTNHATSAPAGTCSWEGRAGGGAGRQAGRPPSSVPQFL